MCIRGAPAAPAPPRAPPLAPRQARQRRAARAVRSWPGRCWPPARAAPGWCRCCWPPSRGGCPARGHASSSRTRAGRRDRSSGRPAGRGSGARARPGRRRCPGTARRTASGIPSGWPSPAAMSAPYSPGGASTASETGSIDGARTAPRLHGPGAPISDMASSRPEDVGLGGDDAGDRAVRIGEQAREGRADPSSRPAARRRRSGISSTSQPRPHGVRRRASAR